MTSEILGQLDAMAIERQMDLETALIKLFTVDGQADLGSRCRKIRLQRIRLTY